MSRSQDLSVCVISSLHYKGKQKQKQTNIGIIKVYNNLVEESNHILAESLFLLHKL